MHVAWFSPLPPHRSGIAAYSADVLPALAARHRIDAYVEGPAFAALPVSGTALHDAHDFSWSFPQEAHDLVVYQLGNDVCHDYMWPYMVRHPGLVVMHDAQLHQARARGLIRKHRDDDYVDEFVYNHPDAHPGLTDLVIAGLGGSLYYLWPMLRVPVEAARLVAVHNRWLATRLLEAFPTARVTVIRMGVPDPLTSVAVVAPEIRRRHGVPEDAVVFAAFGRVTPAKGLTRVLTALAQLGDAASRAHLLCVGDTTASHDIMAIARQVGLADRVHVTGYVSDDDLPSYLAAADACLCLRWPTARETSGSWLRCLAAGKPTVVSDLAHTTDVPTLDVRSMTVDSTTDRGSDPVAVRIDLVDDISMLRRAMRRMTEDGGLRARIGDAARRYWQEHATVDVMARDYDAALTLAASAPVPPRPAGWPAHLAADGTEKARRIAASMGVHLPWLD
jgi:glycosyltransferase involved in cell wall biosynthesis